MLAAAFLIQGALGTCENHINVTGELDYHRILLNQGEELCVNSTIERALVIFKHMGDVNGTLYESKLPIIKPRRGIKLARKALFLKDKALLVAKAKNVTRVEFTTIRVPEICGDNVWYTNKPGMELILNKFKSPLMCAFFATGREQVYSITTKLANKNASVELISYFDNQTISGFVGPSPISVEGLWFMIKNPKPTAEDYVKITDIPVENSEDEGTAGMIQPMNYHNQRIIRICVITGLGCVVMGLLSLMIVTLVIKTPKKGYVSISHIEEPEVL